MHSKKEKITFKYNNNNKGNRFEKWNQMENCSKRKNIFYFMESYLKFYIILYNNKASCLHQK